jgi:hypothetical protein
VPIAIHATGGVISAAAAAQAGPGTPIRVDLARRGPLCALARLLR